ncbi:hypothetical protein BGS_0435 [Beggiatoa sp. SS]|nr:hypothetical protein BGS_0435 [Beggiatoa sp. SS]
MVSTKQTNLIRPDNFLRFLYGFGLVSMKMNKDFKSLGRI